MGHYIDVDFKAKLNDFGKEVITDLYKHLSWSKVVSLYPTSHPSIFAGITDECNRIPFSAHSSLKDIPGSGLDNGIWWAHIMYKWEHAPSNVIHNMLQYMIAEPCVVNEYHELWDNAKITVIQPKEIKE